MRARLPLLLTLLMLAVPASATEVYRCVDARGRLAFQDQPCPPRSRQQLLNLPTPPPAVPAPALAPLRQASSAPPAPPAKPALPLPALYRCIRATDHKPYLSTIGDPQPYAVPLAVLGIQPMSMARTAAPAQRPGPPSNLVSPFTGYYTWVQDRCAPLPRAAVCTNLRERLDQLDTRIEHTFQFDRAPLRHQAATLRAQLQNCH
jgi:hypothetical protein